MASVARPSVSFLERRIGAAPLRASATPAAGHASPAVAGRPVSLRGAGKSYAGRPVLRDLDLDVAAGEFAVIIGRSGSGKSTLLRLLAGLETLDEGALGFGDAAPSRLRVMFQDGRLLPWRRVIDNVALGLPRHERARAAEALAAVGLADRRQDWPRGLSGGQKQRVALARALAAHPDIVLLDEPLGALDALTRLDMQRLIEDLWRHLAFTAILVTHDVAEAVLLADRILLIEDGGVAMDMAIDLPRPRRAGAETALIEAQVLERLLRR